MTNSISGGFTVSLTGKDKMCFIDGTIGGQLFASHDFGRLEVIDSNTNERHYEPIEIKDIIREAVHVYANEPYSNIVINDLDDVSVELLDYKVSNQNCYIYQTSDNEDFTEALATNMAFTKDLIYEEFLKDHYQPGLEGELLGYYNNKYIRVIKYLTYGDTAGYRRTPLIYPSETGELTIDAGGTIGDLLKKIVEAFGEYEYFYDVYGRFVFQRKRIYHNIIWNGTMQDDESSVGYFTSSESSQTVYDFTNGQIIESYANKPDLANVKNDWAIWGSIETGDKNAKYACHLRYAIDDKPLSYHCLTDDVWYCTEGYTIGSDPTASDYIEYLDLIEEYRDYIKPYIQSESLQEEYIRSVVVSAINSHKKIVDWREILYRMAIDYQNAQARIKELEAVNEQFVVGLINGILVSDPASVIDSAGSTVSWYYDSETHTLKTISQLDLDAANEKRLENKLPLLTWEQFVRNQNKQVWFAFGQAKDTWYYGFTGNPANGQYDRSWVSYWTIRGSEFDSWVQNENGGFKPRLKVTKDSMSNIIHKQIKLWESRMNNRYSIYFADMLGFWNIYYKTSNNLTYSDVPDSLRKALTYQSQIASSIAVIGYASAQSTFVNSINSINRQTNIDSAARASLIENAYNAYNAKLQELNAKIQGYRNEVNVKVNDQTTEYAAQYTSTQLTDIFTIATQYYTEQRAHVMQRDSVELTQETYDAYNTNLTLARATFDQAQEQKKLNLVSATYYLWVANSYWNPNVIRCDAQTEYKIKFISPENMLFWIDFLDANAALGKYKVTSIGHRAKVINDDKVKAIFFRDTPTVLWLSPDDEEYEDVDNLSYIRLHLTQGLDNYFQISHQGKSAKDELDTLVYETTHYNETVTINCLPIYYLEPNHRIRVVDNDSGIRGEYIVKNYSLQLAYDGMMSLTAYKAADRII